MNAAKAQMAWNSGLVGPPAPPREVERPGDCTNQFCGRRAQRGRSPAGMVCVQIAGSREPARWYCEGYCAQYGVALAELRRGET